MSIYRCRYIVSRVCDVRSMTRKRDVGFCDVITERDGAAGGARMFVIANICVGQPCTVYILSSAHSIENNQPSTNLRALT